MMIKASVPAPMYMSLPSVVPIDNVGAVPTLRSDAGNAGRRAFRDAFRPLGSEAASRLAPEGVDQLDAFR